MAKPAIPFTPLRVSIFCSCCSCATDFVTSSDMVCSPSQKRFLRPINVHLERLTKPQVKGVKQLDHGIGDTFVYVRTGRDLYGRSEKNLVRSVREWLLDSEKDR